MKRTVRSGSRRGFSLVEVIIATGLLAEIALVIVGLFIVGRRDVQSGRNLTTALSIAQHVSEDLDALGYDSLWNGWRVGSTAVGQNSKRATIEIRRLGNWRIAYVVSSPAYSGETPAASPTDLAGSTILEPLKTRIGTWITELQTLPAPSPEAPLRIVLTPLFDVDDNGTATTTPSTFAATFAGAAVIRVDITVAWQEGQRHRSVTLPQARTFNEM